MVKVILIVVVVVIILSNINHSNNDAMHTLLLMTRLPSEIILGKKNPVVD